MPIGSFCFGAVCTADGLAEGLPCSEPSDRMCSLRGAPPGVALRDMTVFCAAMPFALCADTFLLIPALFDFGTGIPALSALAALAAASDTPWSILLSVSGFVLLLFDKSSDIALRAPFFFFK